MSSILLEDKSNFFNSGKLTFSNIFISVISFPVKFNQTRLTKFKFSRNFISDILLNSKFNSFNFSKFTFFNTFINSINK